MSVKVIQDLDFNYTSSLDDSDTGEYFMKKLPTKIEIGKRYKEVANSHLLFNTKSVELYYQAQKLYCLGLYESSIIVTRAVVEYLVNEYLGENLAEIKDIRVRNYLLDTSDCRKIINDFPFPKDEIFEFYKKSLNRIYTMGNYYVHPKTKINYPKKDALKCINDLRTALNNLKTIFRKYNFVGGRWIKK